MIINMANSRAATDALCAALGLPPGSCDKEPPAYARPRVPYADLLELVWARNLNLLDYCDSPVACHLMALDAAANRIYQPRLL